MTEKKIDDFVTKQEENEITDPWTEEEILAAAKKIIERMGIDGELQ